jgi:uncharacterized membrane protein
VFGISKRALIVFGVLVLVVVVFVIQNKGKSNAQTGADSGSGSCQVQVTATQLNVRETASGTAKVVDKLVSGNTSSATTTVQDGFRELSTGRWASDQFLKKVSGKC